MRRLGFNSSDWRRALAGRKAFPRVFPRALSQAFARTFHGLTASTRLAVGLAAVILLYAFYKVFLCDPRFLEETARGLRHVIKLGLALAVYGLGVFAFYKNSHGWIRSVWHILYIGILVLLTLMGVFDLLGGGLPVPVRVLTVTMFEFLISPVPLVILLVVSRVMEMTPTKA